MPNVRVPSLRLHATGQWFVRWAGKNHYFGRDRQAAVKPYLASLDDWRRWRDTLRRLQSPRGGISITELVDRFCEAKTRELGSATGYYYRKHLRRFEGLTRGARADGVRPILLHELKLSMLENGYAPKTINHDLTAIKVMYHWASALELVPPVDFRGVRSVPLPPPADKSLPLETVKSMILEDATDALRPWLAVNYLGLCRPIEVVRLVHRQGTWTREGVYRLHVKSRVRHVVLSGEALEWLARCQPRWSRLDSYSQACRDACDRGPHCLRHSAATHLARLHGIDRETIDRLLGHAIPRVSATYSAPEYATLRPVAALLTLR